MQPEPAHGLGIAGNRRALEKYNTHPAVFQSRCGRGSRTLRPLRSTSLGSVEFVHRVEHGHNVPYRRLRLCVVDGVEDESAAGSEDLAPP